MSYLDKKEYEKVKLEQAGAMRGALVDIQLC
jgi:hypothetical protein